VPTEFCRGNVPAGCEQLRVLKTAMKSLVLGPSWILRRMKAIRFALINFPTQVLERSRGLLVRLYANTRVVKNRSAFIEPVDLVRSRRLTHNAPVFNI